MLSLPEMDFVVSLNFVQRTRTLAPGLLCLKMRHKFSERSNNLHSIRLEQQSAGMFVSNMVTVKGKCWQITYIQSWTILVLSLTSASNSRTVYGRSEFRHLRLFLRLLLLAFTLA